ncbi:MAG: site-2 protease family protein [bacterium]|nr:site-2 protease family protein [bacterium]
MALLISILGVLFVFSLIIFVHEFGHFIAAKRSGVRVDEFAFGFPPKLWSKKKGDTKYAINLIPLGGYVKIHGDDGSNPDDPTSYAGKPAYIKIIILLAGVTLNFVLAWFILFGGYLFGMQPILPEMAAHNGIQNNMKVVVSNVEKGTPAEKVGIQKSDVIKSVDGQSIKTNFEMLSYFQEKSDKSGGQPISVKIVIERNGGSLEKTITTYKSKQKSGKNEVEINRIGVVVDNKGNIKAPPLIAAKVAFQELGRMMYLTILGVFDLFTKLIMSFQVSDNVAGPVGIFVVTGSFAQMGISALLQFAAVLSIAVGVFNIIPIPGLDGGHTLIVLIETAVRKKFSNKTKNIIQFAGFGALILLMVVVTFKDILRFGIIK